MLKNLLPNNVATEVVLTILNHLDDWPIRSAAAFRNAILGFGSILAINPLMSIKSEEDVVFVKELIKDTVREGRMIDFGHIPNAVIKAEAVRSREMFESHQFQHPYDTWLGVSSWEGGYNGYHVSPHPLYPGEILVIELYGVTIPGVADAVLIYDMVSINPIGPGQTRVSPARMDYETTGRFESDAEIRARGANSLDPLVTMLRLLADASIPITQTEAPAKLNKARAKTGKAPIPAHSTVHTKNYVASFHATYQKRPGQGGHHASPIAHWRRAHQRHLSDGRVIPVKSSKVNWRDIAELHRLFYHIDPPPPK